MAKKLTASVLATPHADVSPMHVEQVAVEGLLQHPRNARTIQPTKEQTAALVASVRAVGVLMPVLLAPMDGGGWGVVAGWQRVRAAQVSGIPTVPAVRMHQPDAMLERVSLLENSLRSDMHPVDTWRSVDTLMRGGATLLGAARALGLSDREATQMRILAGIHPTLLEAMANEDEVPGMWILRDIAQADHARQIEAMNAAWQGKGKSRTLHWNTVAAGCRVTRIARVHAVFDVKTAGVEFQRDFFAEPGSDKEWTTTDVEGFMAAQRAALDAFVAGNEHAGVFDYLPNGWSAAVPREWQQLRWMDKIPKEVPDLPLDQRFVVALKPTGEAAAWVYRVPEASQRTNPENPGSSNLPVEPKRLITDAGLRMAATMKHQALRDALANLHDYPPTDTVPILLRALLECLGAQNVTPGAAQKHAALEAIADATPDGGEPDPLQLVRIATETIAAMLVFPAPKVFSSGPVAESVALSLGADRHLPRFDTADFLAQCSGALLREAARHSDVQPGQRVPNGVGELRHFLVGKLPDWRPVGFLQEAAGDE